MIGAVETNDQLPSEAARFEEVCRFGRERLGPLANTVAMAFADDPIWKWIYHGGDAPLSLADALILAKHLVASQSPVDEIQGFRHHQAVALWHAPLGSDTEKIVADHRSQPSSFADDFLARVATRLPALGALGEAMAERRPSESHWYLGILATHPSRQSQGLGGRLLQHMQARADALGLATYLESSNPENYAFYRRYGYAETEEFRAVDSPPLLGFWRPAH